MEFDITNPGVAQKLIAEINSSQNITRKEDIADGHRIMKGDLLHYVKARLAELWTETHKYFRKANSSLTKKIIDTKSVAYIESPLRKLETEDETTEYKKVTSRGLLDKVMGEFDKTYNLDKYACVWVNLIQDEDSDKGSRFTFRALNQSQFDRIINKETMDTEVVIVSMPGSLVLTQIHGDNTLTHIQDEPEDSSKFKFYAMWTDENHVVAILNTENEEVTVHAITDNENMENPLGMLPFVFLQEGDPLAVPSRPSLPVKDIEINSCKSVLLTGCDIQALGKLIISHPVGMKPPKEFFDSPFTNTSLPQSVEEGAPSTTAEYISPSTNVTEFKEVIEAYERTVIEEEGISVAQTGNVSFTSGFDRSLAMESVRTIVGMNQRDYSWVESGIYKIVQKFTKVKGSNVFKSENVVVLFPKPKPNQTRLEILTEIEKDQALGTIEEWEKHVRLNPNLTEDEAREKEERIQATKMEKAVSFGLPADENEEDDEEESEE